MIDQPKMGVWIAFAIFASITGWLAMFMFQSPVSLLPGLTSAIMTIAALVNCLDWMLWKVTQRVRALYEARSMTEQVQVIRAMAVLNSEQIRLLESSTPVIGVLAGAPSPVRFLRIGGIELTFQFIEEFLRLGDDAYLCPVSTWSEGSKHREHAQVLTNYMLTMGFADNAKGNRPARWINKPGALKWMGLED